MATAGISAKQLAGHHVVLIVMKWVELLARRGRDTEIWRCRYLNDYKTEKLQIYHLLVYIYIHIYIYVYTFTYTYTYTYTCICICPHTSVASPVSSILSFSFSFSFPLSVS